MAAAPEIRRLERALGPLNPRARAEISLKNYVKQAWHIVEPQTPFLDNFHIDCICEHLEACSKGQITRLLINIPPRYMKSRLVSVLWPTWVWGPADRAHTRWLFGSWDQQLVSDQSVERRLIMQSKWFTKQWGERVVIASDQNEKLSYANEARGQMFSTTMGRGSLGHGGNCFPGWTMVDTEEGKIRLDRLVRMFPMPRVLSYNHRNGNCEYRQVIATSSRRAGVFVPIRSGAVYLFPTPEHRIYLASRADYEQAGNLGPVAQVLRLAGDGAELRGVRQYLLAREPAASCGFAKGTSSGSMPGMREGPPRFMGDASLFAMWRTFSDDGLRLEEEITSWFVGDLLRSEMQGRFLSRSIPPASMSRLRGDGRNESSTLCGLSSEVPEGSTASQASEMRMRSFFPAQDFQTSALLAGLCESRSFDPNAREGQFTLQRWAKLCRLVSTNAPTDLGARCESLRRLREAESKIRREMAQQAGLAFDSQYSPYQREYQSERGREFGQPLPALPHEASQIEADAVSVAPPIRIPEIDVYDIQVEGNGNFFAEGVLVHNCIVIDDPHNTKVVESDVERGSVINSFDQDFSRRLNNKFNDVIVLIMQRLHERDMSAHFLEIYKDAVHLKLPAEAEGRTIVYLKPRWRGENENDYIERLTKDRAIKVRRDGELLWPEREGRVQIAEAKLVLTDLGYAGQYQQRPSPKTGSIFHPDKYQFYKLLPPLRRLIGSWDTASKKGQQNDYSCYTLAGQATREYGSRIYVLHQFKEKMKLPELRRQVRLLYQAGSLLQFLSGKQVPCTRSLADKILVEDKSSGTSLIQELEAKDWEELVEKGDSRMFIPIEPIQVDRDKEARAEAATPMLEAGYVTFPNPEVFNVPWLGPLFESMRKFPTAAHDDDIDSLTQLLNFMRANDTPGIIEYYRRKVEYQQKVKDALERGEKPPAPDPIDDLSKKDGSDLIEVYNRARDEALGKRAVIEEEESEEPEVVYPPTQPPSRLQTKEELDQERREAQRRYEEEQRKNGK